MVVGYDDINIYCIRGANGVRPATPDPRSPLALRPCLRHCALIAIIRQFCESSCRVHSTGTALYIVLLCTDATDTTASRVWCHGGEYKAVYV